MGRIETPKTVKVNIKGGEVYIDDNKIPNIESYEILGQGRDMRLVITMECQLMNLSLDTIKQI
ncbi:hypothetical protein [Enterococcus faecalis]|uniref:hypothetical protein n=1 Tax=Enterococcus faecalis TaxID=1351 RepID=UPI003D25F8D0